VFGRIRFKGTQKDGFNKFDGDRNLLKPEEVLDLFEETFVRKLSFQEYTNLWMNLKLIWGME